MRRLHMFSADCAPQRMACCDIKPHTVDSDNVKYTNTRKLTVNIPLQHKCSYLMLNCKHLLTQKHLRFFCTYYFAQYICFLSFFLPSKFFSYFTLNIFLNKQCSVFTYCSQIMKFDGHIKERNHVCVYKQGEVANHIRHYPEHTSVLSDQHFLSKQSQLSGSVGI